MRKERLINALISASQRENEGCSLRKALMKKRVLGINERMTVREEVLRVGGGGSGRCVSRKRLLLSAAFPSRPGR